MRKDFQKLKTCFNPICTWIFIWCCGFREEDFWNIWFIGAFVKLKYMSDSDFFINTKKCKVCKWPSNLSGWMDFFFRNYRLQISYKLCRNHPWISSLTDSSFGSDLTSNMAAMGTFFMLDWILKQNKHKNVPVSVQQSSHQDTCPKPRTSKTGFGQVKIMKEFVLINRTFF
jgi:hypothetical protein